MGTITTITLDDTGNITETKTLGVKRADGSTYDIVNTFSYNANGNLVSKTDWGGSTTKYEYTTGRLTKTSWGRGDEAITTLFSYDAHGNLLQVTDGAGNIKKFTYDQYDRLLSSLSPEGVLRETVYDANNNKTEEILHLENGKTFKNTSAYDLLDQVVGSTVGSDTSDKRTATLTRDANGNVTETIDARGTKTEYVYNALDRVTEKTIGSSTTAYDYDQNGNIVKVIDSLENTTTLAYDSFDRAIAKTDALGTITKYAYNQNGNITETNTFDKTGTLLLKSSGIYNALGKALTQSIVDPKTNTSITSSFEYDQSGNMISKIDPKGNTTTSTYDSLNRLKTTVDALGNKTTLIYDKRGLVTSKNIAGTSGTTLATSYVYDRDGRLVKETNNEGKSKNYSYNTLSQVIQTTDEARNKTDYTYDVFGNILSETKYVSPFTKGVATPEDYQTVTTAHAHDQGNNLISLTDAKGNKTTYEYDTQNRRTKEILPDGATTTFTYDANGNLLSYTDPNGTTVTNVYDVLGRLTKRSIARGTNVLGVTEETYSYDALGRLIGGNDSENNALAFGFDALGRLTSETNNGKTVSYGYDPLGNLTDLISPSWKKVSKTYDPLSRLTGITLDGNTLATYSQNSLTLDTLTLVNGAKTSYGYDSLLRLKSLTNAGLETVKKGKTQTIQESIINQYTFSYDSNSNILSNGTNGYSYDALDRLTSVDRGDSLTGNENMRMLDRDKQEKLSIDYNYDSLGNRDSIEQTLSWTTKKGQEKEKTRIADYTNNALNQYTSVALSKTKSDDDEKNRNPKFIYDRNGNMVDDGKQKYSYDYRNRLVKVESYETNRKGKTETNLIAEFQYDILGRRTTKITYNDEDEVKKIIRYAYANQDAIQEDSYGVRDNKDGKKEILKDSKEYIYWNGIDDILVMLQTTPPVSSRAKSRDPLSNNTTIYFYQKDQLGSVVAITDEKGKVLKEYTYDEFGKVVERKEKSEHWRGFSKVDVSNTRLFTGREYDKEIGLYYYRARYYSAELGRFISRDPIGMSDNINLYTYVGNNPVKFVDPMGLEKALMVINMAYDLFVQKQTEYSLMNKFGDWIDVLDSGFASTGYNTQITTSFVVDTLLWESNIKMREDFWQYTTNRIDDSETKAQFWHAIGWEVYYQWHKIYLSDIGNMIFGFNASNIWYSDGFMKTWQYIETLYKFSWDVQSTLKNEEDDKVLISAGYLLWTLSFWKTLSKDDFTSTLLTAAIGAEAIRLNQK